MEIKFAVIGGILIGLIIGYFVHLTERGKHVKKDNEKPDDNSDYIC